MAASGAIWVKIGRGSNVQMTVVPKSTIAHYANQVFGYDAYYKAKGEIKGYAAMAAKGLATPAEMDELLNDYSDKKVTWSTPKAKSAADTGPEAYQAWQASGKSLNDVRGSAPTAPPVHLPGGVKVQSWAKEGQEITKTREAWQQGYLAVHHPLAKTGQPQDQTWTVTHLPSGLSAVTTIKSQAEAFQAMQYMNFQTDWNFLSAGGGQGLPEAALKAIQAVQHQVYSQPDGRPVPQAQEGSAQEEDDAQGGSGPGPVVHGAGTHPFRHVLGEHHGSKWSNLGQADERQVRRAEDRAHQEAPGRPGRLLQPEPRDGGQGGAGGVRLWEGGPRRFFRTN